ncbi:hypothetical protein N7512_008223 [Penicillium capsulatum]|nr:hypothetical protein N7512_008223 [Penicillium capsulatum]
MLDPVNYRSLSELFKYTNGRFLSEEDRQFSKRYVRFDVNRLCDVIASIPGAGALQVSQIEKMEDGFSKALLVTTADGAEYIVKIPCPNAGRPMYCTASEVAVLNFVKTHTTIPVPKVLAWSSDSTNPVGAEYIVMERVPGVQIFKKWDEMGEGNRISIIKRLTQRERELAEIRFPAFGNLYHKTSDELISLDQSVDPECLFCIGPSCDSAWFIQHSLGAHCGPWKTTKDFGESLINCSLLKSQHDLNLDLSVSLSNSLEGHLVILDIPTLWHTDLHIGNIFVAEDNPAEVTGFINWQHTSINPLFLQVGWPVFLTPPEDYQEGQVLPQLPPNYEDMNADDKEIALYNKEKATWTKAYEDEGILPRREALIEVFRRQGDLGFTESLSLNFNDEQIAAHTKEFQVYQEWHEMRSFVKKVLDTDDDGWGPPELDFTETKSRNKMLFDYYVSKPGLKKTPDEVQDLWPFPLYAWAYHIERRAMAGKSGT